MIAATISRIAGMSRWWPSRSGNRADRRHRPSVGARGGTGVAARFESGAEKATSYSDFCEVGARLIALVAASRRRRTLSQRTENSIRSRWSSPPSLLARARRASISCSCSSLEASRRLAGGPPHLDGGGAAGTRHLEQGPFSSEGRSSWEALLRNGSDPSVRAWRSAAKSRCSWASGLAVVEGTAVPESYRRVLLSHRRGDLVRPGHPVVAGAGAESFNGVIDGSRR